MAKKHWIYIKRGLSEDAKHRERMANRIWLFMHIIDRADWDTGIVYDWRDRDEASDMDLPWRTVQKQRQELAELGYISCDQHQHGQKITIHNWINPKDYTGKAMNIRENTQNSVPSEDTQNSVPLEKSIQGTPQGTLHLCSGLGTPSSISKIIDHRSNTGEDKAPRPRDLLFDAIAKVTHTDPATAGPSIAKVKVTLQKAEPPYTPEEVLKFGETWPAWKDLPPTLWQLKEQIGIVRNGKHANTSASTPSGTRQIEYTPEQLAAADLINAQRAAKQAERG